MIKKLVWVLGLIGVLSFSSCGGGSSKEAKELLEKILQFVGIPQTIIANVCQDANRDGTCGAGELFTKVTINRGDSIDDIWRKLSLTEDGRYFLQTYNPELPILVELQDVAKVNYDDGKFTLAFNGFKTEEDDNETKEISILESMVDANALSKTVADKFRTLSNSEAQDKYYTALLDSLETNINTLRGNELNKTTAISATIKEMADEIKTNQEQADRINSCENNQTCIDSEIKKIKDELIITDEEANSIITDDKNSTRENDTTDNNSSSTLKGWIVPNGVMKDTVGEKDKGRTIPEFIDLKEVSVNVSDTDIRVVMTMVNLPNEFIYNRDTRIKDEGYDNNNSWWVEYSWGISFDINNDYNSDIALNIWGDGNHTSEGERVGTIFDFSTFYIHTPPEEDFIKEDIKSYISIDGNNIIFNIPKSLNQNLNKITPSTKVSFHTSHITTGYSKDYYNDNYPNF